MTREQHVVTGKVVSIDGTIDQRHLEHMTLIGVLVPTASVSGSSLRSFEPVTLKWSHAAADTHADD